MKIVAKLLSMAALVASVWSSSSGEAQPATSQKQVGLDVGVAAPDFKARDQFGHLQDVHTLVGKNGTVLLFFRSADW